MYIKDNISRFWFLCYTSILSVLPLLFATLPFRVRHTREAANFFQALSFYRSGLDSFTYMTLRESDAALHLYSLLSSPLIGLGYYEGGRLVSFVFAIITAVALIYLSKEIWGRKVAVVTPLILWANPFYFIFIWTAQPEAVSIALTSIVVLGIMLYVDRGERKWFGASVVALGLAITNHGWEAIVLLPIVAVLLYERQYLESVLISGYTIAVVVVVKAIASAQPNDADTTAYFIGETGFGVFLSADFWLSMTRGLRNPMLSFLFAHNLMFFGSIVLVIGLSIRFWSDRDRTSLLFLTWILSGLSIPLLLPSGVSHEYYLWGLVAPITLLLAKFAPIAVQSLPPQLSFTSTSIRKTIAVILVLGIIGQAAVYGMFTGVLGLGHLELGEAGTTPLDAQPGEAKEAGIQVRQMGVENPKDIVFTGNWSWPEDDVGQLYRSDVLRVYIYGQVEIRDVWAWSNTEDIPRFKQNTSSINDCQVEVRLEHDQTITVEKCN